MSLDRPDKYFWHHLQVFVGHCDMFWPWAHIDIQHQGTTWEYLGNKMLTNRSLPACNNGQSHAVSSTNSSTFRLNP
jgi:hypothetical protein